MEREISSLLLKSNRTLGSRLVDDGLCRLRDIEDANEAFVSKVRAEDLTQASLLRILIFDKQAIDEASYLDNLIEKHLIGGLSLNSFNVDTRLSGIVHLDVLRATWTLPIDKVDEHYFLATCYYLSDVVRQYWMEKLNHSITWYACSMQDMESMLDRIAIEGRGDQ